MSASPPVQYIPPPFHKLPIFCLRSASVVFQTLSGMGLWNEQKYLPQFLGIGAQKAGTTWLHHNLSAHPELFLPLRRKELHFFDFDRPHFSNEKNLFTFAYAFNFLKAKGRVRGEITTNYSILPMERIRFLKNLIPNVKVILILRDPIERAWSHAVMDLSLAKKRNIDQISRDEFIEHFESEDSQRRGDYFKIIQRWTSVFPSEQIWIGSYKELEDDPKEFLKNIFRFLRVTEEVNWSLFPFQKIYRPVPRDLPMKDDRSPAIPLDLRQKLEEIYPEGVLSGKA